MELTQKGSHAKEANVHNRIEGNRVDGNVLFETRGGDDGCHRGENLLLRTDAHKRYAAELWREAAP